MTKELTYDYVSLIYQYLKITQHHFVDVDTSANSLAASMDVFVHNHFQAFYECLKGFFFSKIISQEKHIFLKVIY